MLPAHQQLKARLMAISKSTSAVNVSTWQRSSRYSSLSPLLNPGPQREMTYLPESSLNTFSLGATSSTISPVIHPVCRSSGRWDYHLWTAEAVKTVLSPRSPNLGTISRSAWMRSDGFLTPLTFPDALKSRPVPFDNLALFAFFVSFRYVRRCGRGLYEAHINGSHYRFLGSLAFNPDLVFVTAIGTWLWSTRSSPAGHGAYHR